jgi:hypothetical protein
MYYLNLFTYSRKNVWVYFIESNNDGAKRFKNNAELNGKTVIQDTLEAAFKHAISS